MYYSDLSTQTAKCGCKIEAYTQCESEPCRCGGGCWDDEYTFTYDLEITEPCEAHGGKS